MNNVYKKDHRENYLRARAMLEVIDVVEADSDDLQHSQFTGTVKETERKQYEGGHLTHITDQCYLIFSNINTFVASVLSKANLKHHQSNLLNVIMSNVHKQFLDNWLNQFQAQQREASTQLFKCMLKTFVKVMAKQFMKDIKLQRQKAHRTQVLLTSKGTCEATSSKQHAKASSTLPTASQVTPSPEEVPNSFDPENDCAKCHVEKGGDWVRCDKCNFWYHCQCILMSNALYQRVKRYKKKKWLCYKCDATSI
jgi:hypothetical protein